MADRLTGIDIEGDIAIKLALNQLPEQALDHASDKIAEYMQNVLRTYPPKNFVSRRTAYPQMQTEPHPVTGTRIKGFASWRQFRYVCYLYSHDKVPYRRTQGLANSWKIVGKGQGTIVVSESEAAHWTMSESQSAHERLVGWKKLSAILAERKDKIEAVFTAAVKTVLKRLRLT